MRRRTKIVATLGPASADEHTIALLVRAGADVFRLNFSHGDHASHARLARRVRRVSRAAGRPVALLADLQGPKIRVGRLRDGAPIALRRGAELIVVASEDVVGEPGRIGCTYAGLARDVRPGERILLDDGNLELEARRVEGRAVHTRVRVGGLLREHRGINLPGTHIRTPALTPKDLADLALCVRLGVDFVALSFVRSAAEVRDLKRRIVALGGRANVVAKIERPEAVARIDEIVAVADAVMIARGDMGVEIGPEDVPGIQKRLVRLAVAHAKPVITATQMLESMIEHARPTRAEASDVANAIYDGTTAVMLSGETASGAYPVEALATMDRIVRKAEADIGARLDAGELAAFPPGAESRAHLDVAATTAEATARAAARAATEARASAVIVLTESGRTASLVARERLVMPVVALTPEPTTWRQLALEWGVVAGRLPRGTAIEPLLAAAEQSAVGLGCAGPGDRVVLVAGRLRARGATDTVRIRAIARGTGRAAARPTRRRSPARSPARSS
ncbi:MAG: pyruvate kinase [bacterium]